MGLRTTSLPVPALIVSEPVGLANVTLSLSVLLIVMFAPAASVRVIVSAPPVNVKIASAIVPVTVIGSSPI